MLHTLTYVSRSLVGPCSVEILDIARASLRNNLRSDVTGALYYDELQFFQTLEGPREAVSETYARIAADPRHIDLSVLHEGPLASRRFGHWSMLFVDGAWMTGPRERYNIDALRAADPSAIAARVEALRLA